MGVLGQHVEGVLPAGASWFCELGGFLERFEHAVTWGPTGVLMHSGQGGGTGGPLRAMIIEGVGIKGALVQEAGSPEGSMPLRGSFFLMRKALGLPCTSYPPATFPLPLWQSSPTP